MRLPATPLARARLPRTCYDGLARGGRRYLTNNGFFRVSEEVREALHSKKPVVALETTIYTHGFPYPENVALASLLESVVRTNGGVPATIGILDGVARVGLDPEELIKLASSAGQSSTLKLSRRDLGYVCGLRLTNKLFNGGTTISGTMLLAHLAGIKVFGTGGLGGVHRGAESSMDISADLTELGRTPVTVVSSGCKSFLDIPRTIEYLETEGVGVGTFADGRTGNVDFPAFWSRDSGVKSPATIADEIEAAAIIHAQHTLQIQSGLLFANPVPTEFAIPKEEMDVIIEEALRQADASNVSGKDNTPFVLAKIKELSKGKSIPANRALIESNVRRATIVARELAVLEAKQEEAQGTNKPHSISVPSSVASSTGRLVSNASSSSETPSSSPTSPLSSVTSTDASAIDVAGALAVDFSCDYAPLFTSPSPIDPLPHTSNPSVITQSLGGVAHNIAKAAHLLGAPVRFHSAVGADLSGRAALAQLKDFGIPTSSIATLPAPARTAQYVAVNNANKDLSIAMADMSILENMSLDAVREAAARLELNPPKVFVVDANWSPEALHIWMNAARKNPDTTVIFEPVSTAKAVRVFPLNPPSSSTSTSSSSASSDGEGSGIFPHHLPTLITPNTYELASLHSHASSSTHLFSHPAYFPILNALGIPSTGARVPLALASSSELVDAGVPQMCIKLLPFFPTIACKLGKEGVLLVKLLRAGDEELHNDAERHYVVARNDNNPIPSPSLSPSSSTNPSGIRNAAESVAGIYTRLFLTPTILPPSQIVSVNGIGDTFCGALAVGLSRGRKVQEVLNFAQMCAAKTLMSRESVGDLSGLRGQI